MLKTKAWFRHIKYIRYSDISKVSLNFDYFDKWVFEFIKKQKFLI